MKRVCETVLTGMVAICRLLADISALWQSCWTSTARSPQTRASRKVTGESGLLCRHVVLSPYCAMPLFIEIKLQSRPMACQHGLRFGLSPCCAVPLLLGSRPTACQHSLQQQCPSSVFLFWKIPFSDLMQMHCTMCVLLYAVCMSL